MRRAPVIAGVVLGVLALFLLGHWQANEPPPPASPTPAAPRGILLYEGTGTSADDVEAWVKVLRRAQLPFITVSSADLESLSTDQLRQSTLLLMPAGNAEQMGLGLSRDAAIRIREAVQGGLHYLGVCAGAFLAGDAPYNALNLTGVRFQTLSAAQGLQKQVLRIERARGPPFSTYWENGPALNGWGERVARYPQGSAAVVQGRVGQGFVLLAGVRFEAPASWYQALKAPDWTTLGHNYALQLLRAAYAGTPLPAFSDRTPDPSTP